MQQIYELLLDKDEVSWKSIICDLVKREEMNPWDIDVSLLTKKFIQIVQMMQKMDCRISGKLILAASALLKLKSTHLVDNELDELTKVMSMEESDWEIGLDEDEIKNELMQRPKLLPRTPMPRDRKVTVHELINALQNVIETRVKKANRTRPQMKIELPKKKIDIPMMMTNVYEKVRDHYDKSENQLMFSHITQTKEDRIYTFLPLLFLEMHTKVRCNQEGHLKDIKINLGGKNEKTHIDNSISTES